MGSHGGSSGPTLQQQQLQTSQLAQAANLNNEENEQRKSILNSMLGTRVFKGSALSRSVRGNAPGNGEENRRPGPSKAQKTALEEPLITAVPSLLTKSTARSSGATPSGGAGGSGSLGSIGVGGGYAGGGGHGGARP